MKASNLKLFHILGIDGMLLLCFAVFLFGICLGLIGDAQRKAARRAWSVAQRNQASVAHVSPEDLNSAKRLNAQLKLLLTSGKSSSEKHFDVSETTISGIELSAAIQSFLHQYREQCESKGILLDDRNLGFSDYIREVAVVSDSNALRLLALQLEELRSLLDVVVASQPIAIVSVKRKVGMHEIPGVEQIIPESGLIKVSSSKFLHEITIRLEFDGYTRSLRQFLNARLSKENDFRIVQLNVLKSTRSEEDRTSQLMDDVAIRVKTVSEKSHAASPFAIYLEPEENRDIDGETQPLIGEVVSRFQLVFERGVEL